MYTIILIQWDTDTFSSTPLQHFFRFRVSAAAALAQRSGVNPLGLRTSWYFDWCPVVFHNPCDDTGSDPRSAAPQMQWRTKKNGEGYKIQDSPQESELASLRCKLQNCLSYKCWEQDVAGFDSELLTKNNTSNNSGSARPQIKANWNNQTEKKCTSNKEPKRKNQSRKTSTAGWDKFCCKAYHL